METSPHPDPRALARQKQEIVAEMLALAREVECSGELETWPPGGRHFEALLAGWSQRRGQWRAGLKSAPAGFLVCSQVSVDLSNGLEVLRTLCYLGRHLSQNDQNDEQRYIADSFRAGFAELLDLLSVTEQWFAEPDRWLREPPAA